VIFGVLADSKDHDNGRLCHAETPHRHQNLGSTRPRTLKIKFRGRVLDLPETLCYPRPVQAKVPLILGGGGEKRTLRLAAQYADAANVHGDVATVRRKAAVLRHHCDHAGRDVELTHLSTALVGRDDAEVAALVEKLRPRRQDPATYAAVVHAGTIDDHIGRFRELAETGVAEVMVRLADLTDPAPLARMAKVISAFR
jgi:alkanesulfonate monooxygenase SsuD/methylene tetrahydromethanopterin reductase-like flavin-dependent oxidoreductase (luciferase family)